jgi:HK97 family phage major capsid protein
MTEQDQELFNRLAKQTADRLKELEKEGKKPESDEEVQKLIKAEFDTLMNTEREKEAEALKEKGRTAGVFDAGISTAKAIDNIDKAVQDPFSFQSKIYSTTKELKQWGYSDKDVNLINEAKELHTKTYLYGKIASQAFDIPYVNAVMGSKIFNQYRERIKSDTDLQKALDTSTSGEGTDLIPTGFAANILELTELQLRLAAQFEQINMPTNPYKHPVQSGRATAYKVSEATTDEPTKIPTTDPGTSNWTFSAVGIASRCLVSYELDEDSIIAIIPYVQNQLVDGLAQGLENAIANGDNSASPQDSDITAGSTDVRTSWKGLRYYGLNASPGTVDFGSANPTVTLLGQMIALAGEYGAMPDMNFWTMGPGVYTKFRITKALNVLAVNEYGPGAVVRTGELGQWAGSAIVPSRHMRENLNASGKYDASTTDLATLLHVHAGGFKLGRRRAVLVESGRKIAQQQMELVASMRVDFKPPWDPTAAAYPFVICGIELKPD